MRKSTAAVFAVLIIGCIVNGRSLALENVKTTAHSEFANNEKTADIAERMQRHYDAAVQLRGGQIVSSDPEPAENENGEESDELVADEWQVSEKATEEEMCLIQRMHNLGRCGWYVAKKFNKLKRKLEEDCKSSLSVSDEPLGESCKFFTDHWGRHRITVLVRTFDETVTSCSSPSIVLDAESRQGDLEFTNRQFPNPGAIKDLLDVLKKLNDLLKGINPTPTPSLRRLVVKNLKQGVNQKTARLMAYNNISFGQGSSS